MTEYIEPLWCEDCGFFNCLGMDGEGECEVGANEDVWYAHPICSDFKAKEKTIDGTEVDNG